LRGVISAGSEQGEGAETPAAATMRITVTEDGPYQVRGSVPLFMQTIVPDTEGGSVEWEQGRRLDTTDAYRLCRCGQSANKPFCDGSHERVGFHGTETASREPYLAQAGEEDGPTVRLTDAEPLCAYARFCDVGGSIWDLVQRTGPEASALAVREGARCPSGRLVVWDRSTRQPLEPELEPSIGLVEDPAEGVSGPLWVRGGIQIVSAQGIPYETRNRVTICRCGASENKPFCDGSHAAIGFDDGLRGAPAR
jgi:CDGSH-type Zn-finger protein